MALDGMFLFKCADELRSALKDTRIEKIYQPSKDELIFVMRSRECAKKLYISSRADGGGIHITKNEFRNPEKPPMLCMLLRKKFTSARFESISQDDLERVLTLNFSAVNEMGDVVSLKIIVEIMGRYSNTVFTDENGIIIDSLKRIGASKSSVREILPGMKYVSPPVQDKLSILNATNEEIYERIIQNENILFSKSVLKTLKGISPLLSNELAVYAFGNDMPIYEIKTNKETIYESLNYLRDWLINKESYPNIVSISKKHIEFSFMPINQYGSLCVCEKYDSLGDALDAFYSQKDKALRSTQLGGELSRFVEQTTERLIKKIAVQNVELEKSNNNEHLKLYGELINANLYTLKSGESEYRVNNYYTGQDIVIPVNNMLSPSENSQKYYKEYRKSETAKIKLQEQINKAEDELEYFESLNDLLSRATLPEEVLAIKNELTLQGYLKRKISRKERTPKELKPFEFESSGGFKILVGRNNTLNDKLTFKIASGNDIWFHTKNIHGSHTVLFTNGREVGEQDIIEASQICAYFSKARASSSVPVDYTKDKFVKRQPNSLPGKVFYTDYKTVYVTPSSKIIEKLKR